MQVITKFWDVCGDVLWTLMENDGRECFWGIATNKLPEELTKERCSFTKLDDFIIRLAEQESFDPARLPHIEDVDPLFKALYTNLVESENCMWFVDLPQAGEEEDSFEWAEVGREEYERRIDAVIRKYHLEDVVEKGAEDWLYCCYGNLQSRFSERYLED